MLGQIASHRLFVWAVEVTKSLYGAIINSDPAKSRLYQLFLDSFDTMFA